MLAIGIDVSKATFNTALDDLLVRKIKNTADGIVAFISEVKALGHDPGTTMIGR